MSGRLPKKWSDFTLSWHVDHIERKAIAYQSGRRIGFPLSLGLL
jgi:hypothetical protein